MSSTNNTSWILPLDTSNRSSIETEVLPHCPWLGMKSSAAKTIQVILYSLIIFGSLCGNCLVIAIVVTTTKLKTTINYLVANMAISDLLVPVFAVPVKIAETLSGNSWLVSGSLGEILCKLIPFCVDISTAVSIQSSVVIALDRYYALIHPLKQHILTRRRCMVTIGLIWFFAALFHAPYFYTFRLVPFGDHLYCLRSWEPAFHDNYKTAEHIHYLVIFVLLYSVPLLTICALYTIIACDLIQKQRKHLHDHCIVSRRRTNENRRVACMMATVVMVFTVCYTPSHICLMLYYNDSKILGCYSELFFNISLFMFYINGALNPMIYFVFSRKYSSAVKKLIRKFRNAFS